MLEIMLQANPDITLENANGEDAITIAVNNDFEDVTAILEEYAKNKASNSTTGAASASGISHLKSFMLSFKGGPLEAEVARLRAENDLLKQIVYQIKDHLNNDSQLNNLIYKLKKL